MPRTSERRQVLEDLESAIESATCDYVLSPLADRDRNKAMEKHIRDLLTIHDVIASQRYLFSRTGAGRHSEASLEAYIRDSPEATFLALFRIHRTSFWQLVELLTQAGGGDYWSQGSDTRGRPARPIYQQIAVGLYVLGGGGGTAEKTHIALDIGHGTVWRYAWHTIKLLARLVPEYIRWHQYPIESGHNVFRHCIGFLDGLSIVLRDRPIVDSEAYYSRNKNYGFNLQAICDWDGRFIWVFMGHTASVHDSTAFKSTALYRNSSSHFDPEEYVLADKAYPLEQHVITPYTSREQPMNAAFNYELSAPRGKIQHTFGVLKARWPTLSNIPVRINTDKEDGHQRVMDWTMACLVLQNILHDMQDDSTWLHEDINHELAEISNSNNSDYLEGSSNTEAEQAGIRRRDELRELLAMLQARA